MGSFSAAARRLAMPLSTVSRKVSSLEASLNVKLLERSTRSLRLTEIGTAYFDQCRQGIGAFTTANLLVQDRQAQIAGMLRISLPPSLAQGLFVPIIGLFQKRYPQAKVAVFITERIVDRIEEGIDLSFRVGPIADSRLAARKLLTYRHLLVGAPAYLGEHASPQSPAALTKHRLIAFGFWREAEKRWTLSARKKQETVSFEPNVSFNDYAAILRAVIQGQGIAKVPSILCGEALSKREIVEILPSWQFQEINLQAVHTGTKNMARLTRLFLDACSEHIGFYAGSSQQSLQ
ncbi:MAG: LysR family transcriptional regulator [Alphaproteobacteria bacterium]